VKHPTQRKPNAQSADIERPLQGFSLIEVVIATAISITLAAGAMGTLLTVERTRREGSQRAQMNRNAQVALDLLEYDMKFLGASVPGGIECTNASCSGTEPGLFPIIRIGEPQALVFLGDLPYPNTNFNGTMSVNGGDGATGTVLVTSELSGACRPTTSPPPGLACDTKASTLVPFGSTSGARCTGAATGERTCPWGMGKWQAGNGNLVWVQLVGNQGDYWEHCHSATFGSVGASQGADILVGPTNDFRGLQFHATCLDGPGYDATEMEAGAYVTQLDRVFWIAHEMGDPTSACPNDGSVLCQISRRQCWGRLDGAPASTMPDYTNGFFNANTTPAFCAHNTTPPDGTNWESVIDNVYSVQFVYIQDTASFAVNNTTDAGNVRAIEIEFLLLENANVSGVEFRQRYRRRFFLENRESP